MCEPISIGIAIGAATGAVSSAITGGDVLQGALMGGIMGGVGGAFMPAMSIATPFSSGLTSSVGSFFGASTQVLGSMGMSAAQAVGMGAMGLAGGRAMGVMSPQQEYNAESYNYSPIAYNSQENQVTGSGGAQASAVLSDEIKRAKAKRSKQAQPKQDSYINTESFSNSGLQIA